jgi:hypothetical protein
MEALTAGKLQVTLHEFAKLVTVVAFHVDKLDSIAAGTSVANDGGEMNFSQS